MATCWVPQAALLLLLMWTTACNAETNLGRLRRKLLNGYDKTSRPVLKDDVPVYVKMAFYVRHLQQLDEKTEILSVEGTIVMEWKDEHMVWNPAEYGNITTIHLADHEIWQPDVYLFQSIGQNTVDGDKSTYLVIHASGNVTWIPQASLRVPCRTSHTYYPFEKHVCTFEFGSWTHSGDDLFLQPYEDYTIDELHDVTGGEWSIVHWNYTAREYYVIKTHPYNSINLTLTLQRTTSIHKITSVVPVITSSILTLAGFSLDIWSTSRYVLGLGNFAMVALHLLEFGSTAPAGRDVPLIAKFSATVVCMSAVFLVLTVVLDSTQRRRSCPPENLVRLCKQLPEKAFCLPEETVRPAAESTSADDGTKKMLGDWRLICRVFDRIAFILFSIIYVVVTSLLFSVV